ncbi:DUF4199 domain-containing protein [Mariniflexile ostreae]|uniref:DUF4199 domain-containing protein n=1 Tax=Mariniflexile ostreae TaxID=1520892 RepID=A0ABV5F9C8_9FLAO
MPSQSLSPGKFATNYGLILGAVMMLITIITYATGMAIEAVQWPNYIYYIIFPIVILYVISAYKKQNAGLLTLSEALKIGVTIAVISALVNVVYGLIFHYIIDPQFASQLTERIGEKMLENQSISPEMVEKQMEMMKKFQNPLIGSAIWVALSAIFGLLYSLVGGVIMKKED